MKSFKQYLLEADYSRFLKKNRNLTDDQREEINKYYSKTNTHAASDIKWQSREIKNWKYSDFEMHMSQFTSGRIATFKKPTIPGKKGKDYWEIRLKVKGYYAAIPLTQETATYMNSEKYGCEGANYCIGWDGDAQNWDDIVIGEQQVPVYITNGGLKWVVMIHENNREYDVWDKMNSFAKIKTTKIPGFDIKKNLLTSPLKNLYDELREDFFSEDDRATPEPDWSGAQDDYDRLVNKIEEAKKEIEENEEEFEKEMEHIKSRTISYYEKKVEELEPLSNAAEEEVDELEVFKGDDTFIWKGKQYTKKDYKGLLDDAKEKFDDVYEEYEEASNALSEIEDMYTSDMPNHYEDYEWQGGDVPDEDEAWERKTNVRSYPSDLSIYSDLAEYAEMNGSVLDNDNLIQAIWSYIFEGGYRETARSVLHDYGIYRPQ